MECESLDFPANPLANRGFVAAWLVVSMHIMLW